MIHTSTLARWKNHEQSKILSNMTSNSVAHYMPAPATRLVASSLEHSDCRFLLAGISVLLVELLAFHGKLVVYGDLREPGGYGWVCPKQTRWFKLPSSPWGPLLQNTSKPHSPCWRHQLPTEPQAQYMVIFLTQVS